MILPQYLHEVKYFLEKKRMRIGSSLGAVLYATS